MNTILYAGISSIYNYIIPTCIATDNNTQQNITGTNLIFNSTLNGIPITLVQGNQLITANNTNLDTYVLNYTAIDEYKISVTKSINIITTTPPSITITDNNTASTVADKTTLYTGINYIYSIPTFSAFDYNINQPITGSNLKINNSYTTGLSNITNYSNNLPTNISGTYTLIYSATDSKGISLSKTIYILIGNSPSITITNNNTSPSSTINNGTTLYVGYTYTYSIPTAIAYDNNYSPSHQILNLLIITSPSGSTMTATNTSSFNLGTYTLIYSTTDSKGVSLSQTIYISIVNPPYITITGTIINYIGYPQTNSPITSTPTQLTIPNATATVGSATVGITGVTTNNSQCMVSYTFTSSIPNVPVSSSISILLSNIISSPPLIPTSLGYYTLTYTATDSNNVIGTKQITVNVVTPPSISIILPNPSSYTSYGGTLSTNLYAGYNTTGYNYIAPTFTSGNNTLSLTGTFLSSISGSAPTSVPSLTTTGINHLIPSSTGTYTLNYTATNSNNVSTTQVVIIIVETPPTIIITNQNIISNPPILSNGTTLYTGLGQVYYIPSFIATDNTGLKILSPNSSVNSLTPNIITATDLSSFNLGTYTLTYSATDSKGVSSSQTIYINIVNPPYITITGTIINYIGYPQTNSPITSTPTQLTIPNATATVGAATVGITGVTTNNSQCMVSYTFTSSIPNVPISSSTSILLSNIISSPPLIPTSLGYYTLTYTATDSNNVIGTKQITVNVVTPPSISINIIPPSSSNNYTSYGGTLSTNLYAGYNTTGYNYIAPTFTSGNNTLSLTGTFLSSISGSAPTSVPSLTTTGINHLIPSSTGTYTLNYTATNTNNVSTTQVVTIIVETPPTITITNQNISNPPILSNGTTLYTGLGQVYYIPSFIATDNTGLRILSPNSSVTSLTPNIITATDLSSFNLGTYTLTYSATDSKGVSSSQTIYINIVNPPYITITGTIINYIGYPQTNSPITSTPTQLTIPNATATVGAATVGITGVTTNNSQCMVSYTFTSSIPNVPISSSTSILLSRINSSPSLTPTSLGHYTLTYTATDSNNVIGTKQITVNVVTPPNISINIIPPSSSNNYTAYGGTLSTNLYAGCGSTGYNYIAPTFTSGNNTLSLTGTFLSSISGSTPTSVSSLTTTGINSLTTSSTGTYTLNYTATNTNNISTTQVVTIIVEIPPTITITNQNIISNSPIISNGTTLYTGLGYTYYIPTAKAYDNNTQTNTPIIATSSSHVGYSNLIDIINYSANLPTTYTGTYTINYTFLDINNVPSSKTIYITIENFPIITITKTITNSYIGYQPLLYPITSNPTQLIIPSANATVGANVTGTISSSNISYNFTSNQGIVGNTFTTNLQNSTNISLNSSSTLGFYTVIYSATDTNNVTTTKQFTVTVEIPPSISITTIIPISGYTAYGGILPNTLYAGVGYKYSTPSFTANDNSSGSIIPINTNNLSVSYTLNGISGISNFLSSGSDLTPTSIGTYKLSYTATDSNSVSTTQVVTIIVENPPTITLPFKVYTVPQNSGNYILPIPTTSIIGGTPQNSIIDSNQNSITVINTKTISSYTVTYTITDINGVSAIPLIITINVTSTILSLSSITLISTYNNNSFITDNTIAGLGRVYCNTTYNEFKNVNTPTYFSIPFNNYAYSNKNTQTSNLFNHLYIFSTVSSASNWTCTDLFPLLQTALPNVITTGCNFFCQFGNGGIANGIILLEIYLSNNSTIAPYFALSTDNGNSWQFINTIYVLNTTTSNNTNYILPTSNNSNISSVVKNTGKTNYPIEFNGINGLGVFVANNKFFLTYPITSIKSVVIFQLMDIIGLLYNHSL